MTSTSTADYHLVVSVPPHRDEWDAAQAAAAFGVTPTEMRMKAAYPAPEVWIADQDDGRAESKYDQLQAAGLNVIFTDTGIVRSIPARLPVRSFVVVKAGIVWDVGHERTVETPTSTRGILVYGKPRTGAASHRPAGSHPARTQVIGLECSYVNPAFVDLYFEEDNRIRRLSLASAAGVKFSGLGDKMRNTFGENCAVLANLLRSQFRSVREDGRLMEIPPRWTQVNGVGLPKLLDALRLPAGSMRDLDPLELGSRLVFLTSSWA